MNAPLRVLLVDHQDSFTWNLAHAFGAVTGALPEVVDSRELEPRQVAAAPPDLLVLGAGPGHPEQARDAGRSLELIRALPAGVPIFGVCFGLQLLVTAFGGKVVAAAAPVHGKSLPVVHEPHGGADAGALFAGLPSPVAMMRYHSLVAERGSLPREFVVVGESPLGEVMAIAHAQRPIWAVQFHPESIGSPLGARLIENVVALARQRRDPVVAVLAAGRSSRMGFPKALADVAGETALARLLRIAGAQRLRALVVLGFHEAEIRAGCERELAGASVTVNPAPERGQSSSARLAAQTLGDGDSLALWPVDHARVQEATFARLLAAFRSRAAGIELVVPSFGGRRGHPLLASPLVRREFAALADDEPAHLVVRRDPRRVLHVVVDDPMVVADFDRPEDLAGRPKDVQCRPEEIQ